MPVLINFKICDNAEVCNAINVCPTGAFHWNEEKKTLEVDSDKCINCGACATSEKSCQVGAIRWAKTEEEAKRIKKEIAEDPRTVADLMVDRYGADPINMPFYCEEDEIAKVLTTSKICLIEVFKGDTECLIKSIPVKEILNDIAEDCVYRKSEIKTDNLLKKYQIKDIPALLIFKDKEILGKVEGYYSVEQKEEFINKIRDVIHLAKKEGNE